MRLVNRINASLLIGLLTFSGVNTKVYAEDKGVGFRRYSVSQESEVFMLVGFPMLALSIAFPPSAVLFAIMIASPHFRTPKMLDLDDLKEDAHRGDGKTLKSALKRINNDYKNTYKEVRKVRKVSKDSLIVVTKDELIQAIIELDHVVEVVGDGTNHCEGFATWGYSSTMTSIKTRILFNRLPDEIKREIEDELKKDTAKNRFKNRFEKHSPQFLIRYDGLTENEEKVYSNNRQVLIDVLNNYDFDENSSIEDAEKVLDEQAPILGLDTINGAKKVLRYELLNPCRFPNIADSVLW